MVLEKPLVRNILNAATPRAIGSGFIYFLLDGWPCGLGPMSGVSAARPEKGLVNPAVYASMASEFFDLQTTLFDSLAAAVPGQPDLC